MYTEPEIIAAKRAYIKCYIDGVRELFYNGKRISIQCNPNKCKAPDAKARELERLKYQLKKKLDAGWRPTLSAIITPPKAVSATRAIKEAFNTMSKEQISAHYLRQVESTKAEFIACWLKNRRFSLLIYRKRTLKNFSPSLPTATTPT